jgi:hypothetical protein
MNHEHFPFLLLHLFLNKIIRLFNKVCTCQQYPHLQFGQFYGTFYLSWVRDKYDFIQRLRYGFWDWPNWPNCSSLEKKHWWTAIPNTFSTFSTFSIQYVSNFSMMLVDKNVITAFEILNEDLQNKQGESHLAIKIIVSCDWFLPFVLL